MLTKTPREMTWTPLDQAGRLFDQYADTPIPDHADCAGLPNRYDFLDGMIKFPADGYPGQDSGVFGYAVVSVCPLCGQWWHWEHKVFTKAGVIIDE